MKEDVRTISGALRTERLVDNGHRKLLRDFSIMVGDKLITVPKDMVTDYSSIPRFGRLFLRWSKVDIAGVVHDWLYETATYSRFEADGVWRDVALAGSHHANLVQAWGGWFFLRIGGWYAWNKCREKERMETLCGHLLD